MAQFVFEIGMEEIPARFVAGLKQSLKSQFEKALQQEQIDFQNLQVFIAPRRMLVRIFEISSTQKSSEQLVTGPPARIAYDNQGALTKAGLGFAKSQKVEPEELFVQENKKGAYLAVLKQVGGQSTGSILPGICSEIVSHLPFPKKMRWEESGFSFGRPIRWLLALLDQKIIPVNIASLESDRITHGHRVLGPGPFEVREAAQYLELIRKQGRVILDPEERLEIIKNQGNDLARDKEGQVAWNEDLLWEVANLSEYPKPMLGRFDPVYLQLPREVLLTSMESHQKSFGIEDKQGKLLPFFLCTLDLEPVDPDLVRKGWERVLKARLEDARFFWEADSRTSLKQWLEKLDKVIFLGPLGSMGHKSQRLKNLTGYLAARSAPEIEQEISRAALLAKTDLVSEMVGEFADLQGIMGGIYAGQKGESELVSKAIFEHYLPSGQESPVPGSVGGALLSIADKADNLIGCFGLGMIPTGANDPYALRRQALGIIRIILAHGFRFSIKDLLVQAQQEYQQVNWKYSPEEFLKALSDFFKQRLKAYFSAEGYNTRVVEAALGAGIDDIWSFRERLKSLHRFSQEDDFEQAVLTFKRAANIIRKQGDQAEQALDGNYKTGLLQEAQEKKLAETLEEIGPRWERLWSEEGFDQLFALLRELRPLVDAFFDHVMVMSEEQNLRLNRLNLLKSLVDRLFLLADFNALQI